jgi:hypothetical protein
LEEDGKVCKGDEVSTSFTAKVLTKSGVAKPKEGKSSKLSRLKHLSMSREEKMSMFFFFQISFKGRVFNRKLFKIKFLRYFRRR